MPCSFTDSPATDAQPPAKKVKTAETSNDEVPNGHAAEEEVEEEEEEEDEEDGEGDDAEADDDDAEAEDDVPAPSKEAVKATDAPVSVPETKEVKAVAAGGEEA